MGGGQAGEECLAAYLIEKSLSVDNVFVFSVIFSSFAVPKEYRYHVLFYGVIGAIAFRAIFVFLGIGLLSTFTWLVFFFGAFLILTGFRMFRREDGQVTDYRNSRVLRLLRRYMPITDDYHGDNFFVSKAGRRCATPLLAALVVVEASDVIFAVDSVPAVLSMERYLKESAGAGGPPPARGDHLGATPKTRA